MGRRVAIELRTAELEFKFITAPTSVQDAQGGHIGDLARGEDERNGRCVRRSLIPTIRDIQRHGAPSLHSIADTLNTRGIPTARGKTWTAMQVSNVLARAGV